MDRQSQTAEQTGWQKEQSLPCLILVEAPVIYQVFLWCSQHQSQLSRVPITNFKLYLFLVELAAVPNLETIFKAQYQPAGAKIHSASWGSNKNAYSSMDRTADKFMYVSSFALLFFTTLLRLLTGIRIFLDFEGTTIQTFYLLSPQYVIVDADVFIHRQYEGLLTHVALLF
jgi:hypothetical protein